MSEDYDPELDSNHDDIYEIAKCQKIVLLCIFINIGIGIASLSVSEDASQSILYIRVAVSLGIVFFIFQLAKKLYPIIAAILATVAFVGFGVFVPLIGFLVLIVINRDATKAIQAKGFDVGVLGANMKQFH